jgi:murein DD-endopeptidase MepM/ murein hydrolase activator NlpD
MKARHASGLAFAAICGFLAGMGVMAVLVVIYRPMPALSPQPPPADTPVGAPAGSAATPPGEVRRSQDDTAPVTPPDAVAPIAPGAAAPADTSEPAVELVEELRRRRLEVPVLGVKREDLRDTFDEQRGGTRRHEAIDLLAPRHTPVVAVEDGVVARLFTSAAGGTTVYQFDPTTTVAYYYAHLERYADGLKEGAAVVRGQVLGYVGTSGNAPKDTPHLHFAVFQLTSEKRWWQGTPIDPFLVLK